MPAVYVTTDTATVLVCTSSAVPSAASEHVSWRLMNDSSGVVLHWSVDGYVADRLCVIVAWPRHSSDVLVKRQTPVCATGRSMPVIFTDVRDDAARGWLAVPMVTACSLSAFSWSPFCMNQSLTPAVQAVRTDRPEAVLSTLITRWSWVSLVDWWWQKP